MCVALGTSGFAQTGSDFLDPLDEERGRVERLEGSSERAPAMTGKPARSNASPSDREGSSFLNRARDGATSGASTAQDKAVGFWGRMKASVSDLANQFGLSTAGLLGLLGLVLMGLVALIGWTLFRGRRGPRRDKSDGSVYARSKRAIGRRKLGDTDPLKTASARMDDVEDDFDDQNPEGFESIFEEERTGKTAQPKAKAADTTKWRKPNLDRLRDSIKADWKADKRRSVEDDDAPFEDDDMPTPARSAARAMPGTPAATSLGDISDGWEDWDEQVKPEDDPWGETLTTDREAEPEEEDDAAVQRIRALRESLRAS